VTYAPEALVVAGAGSGKTTLLLARAKYLEESGRSSPIGVLALAFNRAAAQEIQERADATGIHLTAMTFHSFGNSILNFKGRLGGVAFPEEQEKVKFFDERIAESLADTSRSRLLEFFSEMLIPVKDQSTFKTMNDYSAYMKAIPRTFSKHRVKSHGEFVIANYLFCRGVEFEYEAFYQEGERGAWHRPDFTVQGPVGKIYIEYFGVDKDLNTAPFVPREKYVREMELKRQTHGANNTELVELTYQNLIDGCLIENLRSRLDELEVSNEGRSAKELAAVARELDYTTRFNKLCVAFLSHARSRQLTSSGIRNLSRRDRRTQAFVEIFSDYLRQYEFELDRLGLPDYQAMINQAADELAGGLTSFDFDHVLVDEFQDISVDRERLLASMKLANPNVQFLYVGDDWQSINRFAGADVGIMKRASQPSPDRKIFRLEETFRFPQALADISSHFIQKNPRQINKLITSKNPSNPSQVIFLHNCSGDGNHAEKLQVAISDIAAGNDGRNSLLVLARYNSNLPDGTEVARLWNGPFEIKSIHRSKGSEADFVIIMDAIQDYRGFPSTIEDDPLLEIVMPESEVFEYAEERRLMYVAMTRARIACHVISSREEPSLFVEELLSELRNTNAAEFNLETVRCPVCLTGWIARSHNDGGSHCSSSPYCTFRSPKCPVCTSRLHLVSTSPFIFGCTEHDDQKFETCGLCGWGVLIDREGRWGPFRACSNYSIIGCKGR
jgi:DNA helicase-4